MASGTVKKGFKLLWTNPSPTASFAAQAVPVDLTGYDFLAVEVIFNLSNPVLFPVCLYAASVTDFYMPVNAQSSNNSGARQGSYSSVQKKITFSSASYNGSTNNNYVIPLYIWGVKL